MEPPSSHFLFLFMAAPPPFSCSDPATFWLPFFTNSGRTCYHRDTVLFAIICMDIVSHVVHLFSKPAFLSKQDDRGHWCLLHIYQAPQAGTLGDTEIDLQAPPEVFWSILSNEGTEAQRGLMTFPGTVWCQIWCQREREKKNVVGWSSLEQASQMQWLWAKPWLGGQEAKREHCVWAASQRFQTHRDNVSIYGFQRLSLTSFKKAVLRLIAWFGACKHWNVLERSKFGGKWTLWQQVENGINADYEAENLYINCRSKEDSHPR